jgi:hypothetical protein
MEDTYFDTFGDAASDGEFDDVSGWEDDAYFAQYDDDPNPYHGDYSEM